MDEILSKLRKTSKKEEESDSFISSTLEDITSSQCQTPFTIMKLDFDRLRCIKENQSGFMNINEVLKSEEYKINMSIIGLVKKIEKFSSEICYLELVDETGSIGCSCLYKLIKDNELNLGNILKLQNVSLWKIDINHINLVHENLLEIF
ncbi:hypothetical protein NAPIS_ORF00830 [Vairimorpha apis BRL 01]|uniref:OB domain-containing protein n=1 Tax=Vairimorpha apis BRL 01 TaxID=1037528 RepID=T0MKS9_9MICR|nr:hypothetical protein NAPIS_ORF00830 [Vairimorpha apis BRL 01]